MRAIGLRMGGKRKRKGIDSPPAGNRKSSVKSVNQYVIV